MLPPTNHSSSQKTRINILSYGIKIWTDLSSILSGITRVTDRQTDRILIARPRLHFMQRGKKEQQSLIMSLLFVLNSFMRNRNIAKSDDRISDSSNGQTSVSYRRIGMHLLYTNGGRHLLKPDGQLFQKKRLLLSDKRNAWRGLGSILGFLN